MAGRQSKTLSFGDVITGRGNGEGKRKPASLTPLSSTPQPILKKDVSPDAAQSPKRHGALAAITPTPTLDRSGPSAANPAVSPRLDAVSRFRQMHSVKPYDVDYSFFELTDLEEILDRGARTGLLRKDLLASRAASGSPTSEEAAAAAAKRQQQLSANLAQHSSHVNEAWQEHLKNTTLGKTKVTGDGTTLIKARDETYAFKQLETFAIVDKTKNSKRFTVDENGNLVERNLSIEELAAEAEELQYMCTFLQLRNNALTTESFAGFNWVMAQRFWAPTQHLTRLDLSFNEIDEVPASLEALPLHTLLLHCNKIASLKSLMNLHAIGETLRKFSINENPLQEQHGRKLKWILLYCFPFISTLDDVTVTRADREKLGLFASMFGKNYHALTREGWSEKKAAAEAAAKRAAEQRQRYY